MASVSVQGHTLLSQRCQTCSTASVKIFTCIQCNSLAFCDPCWSKWVLHVPGAVGWGGKPHEKADLVVIQRLRQIFEPLRTETDHEVELARDQETTWFGFGRDSSGHPIFQDYGRLAAIMSESHVVGTTDRYPQLVSFIGETGAGKSTLIKLLIDRQDLHSPETSNYHTPVTSSSNDYIPTTADVHLYTEPSTLFTDIPLLFIDCEGLNGGEAMPKALRYFQQDTNREGNIGRRNSEYACPSQTRINMLPPSRYNSQRYITWANSPQTQKREYTVSQLYPRILYTFSDVVVFVLRNPRSFESTVLDKLVSWGAASVDKSLNQPTLPHAIVVLNATEDVDEKEWDVETATNKLMSAIQDAISQEPALDEYVRAWRKRGKEINSTEDLLSQCYASVTVFRVPRQGSYMLLDQQAATLFDLIKKRCSDSHLKKRQARMLANAEMLQLYLHASYDHFTKDLESPFDFVKEALRHNPVSRSFEGNILRLAVSMKSYARSLVLRNDANIIFLKLAPMIASCIMFDAVRQHRLGTAEQLLSNAYAQLCVSALYTFANLYWPCNFFNPVYRQGRCCNVLSGHNPKGYQNEHGKIIGYGKYQSNFDHSTFIPEWNHLIQDSLTKIQAASYELGQRIPGRSDLQIASILHRERINNFYNTLGNPVDFVSHSACFSCLRGLPECVLPCSHVLCLECVKIYGRTTSRTTVELNRCPLHIREIMADPPAGGIIALGLGVNGWSIDETIKKFKILYTEAFTPREMMGIPLLDNLSSTYHGSIYKTKPLGKALKTSFSDRNLFGNVQSRNEMPTRVAVTSTTAPGHKEVVFSNYNRPEPLSQSLSYEFIRPSEPSNEVKIWEAARATSAMSPYFKPFRKTETGNQYIDGGLRQACPVWVAHQEMNLIWSDVANSPPDIVLSVGAGCIVRNEDSFRGDRSSLGIDSSSKTTTPPAKLIGKSSSTMGNLADYQKRSRTWDQFMARRSSSNLLETAEDTSRYIRISPELNIRAPRFDDIQRLDEVEREAEEVLQQNMAEIKEVAHRLVASAFFFEKDDSVKQTPSGYTCKGEF
ncbi:FabD/lysophospholipase-like protein [Hypoxylon sp. EC38]|nr:FabD/lysophospholipase-like protein [Hypoxylon sp. EC38]